MGAEYRWIDNTKPTRHWRTIRNDSIFISIAGALIISSVTYFRLMNSDADALRKTLAVIVCIIGIITLPIVGFLNLRRMRRNWPFRIGINDNEVVLDYEKLPRRVVAWKDIIDVKIYRSEKYCTQGGFIVKGEKYPIPNICGNAMEVVYEKWNEVKWRKLD